MLTLREEAIDLWRVCFEDTEDFIRFYFERKYQDENTLVCRKFDKVVAALQMIPYPMNWEGTEVSASYISGACTLPEARNQGIMRKLLAQSFGVMLQREIAFCILIPANPGLYKYYGASGFAPVFGYKSKKYYLPAINPSEKVTVADPAMCQAIRPALFGYFNSHIRSRPYAVLHTANDLDAIIDDLYADDGRVLVLQNANREIKGIAFARPYADKISIDELICYSEAAKSALLHTAAHHWGKNEIECKIPARSGVAQPGGMARIIDVPRILSLYASHHPQQSLSLHVTDKELPGNEGYYSLKNGDCTRSSMPTGQTDQEMDPVTLSQFLFKQPAFINLMLE